MRCAEHPRYGAKRQPVKTVKHPDGCPICWGVWEAAKVDPKKLLKTVNIELDPDEARTLALSLDALLKRRDPELVRLLTPFYAIVVKALRA